MVISIGEIITKKQLFIKKWINMSLNIKKIITEEIAKLFELEALLEKYPDLKEKINTYNGLVEEYHEDLKKIQQGILKVGIGDGSKKLEGFDKKLEDIEKEFKTIQAYMDHFLTIDDVTEDEIFVAEDVADRINMYVRVIDNLRDIIYDYKNSLEELREKLGQSTLKAINSLENTPKDKYKIFMN